VDRVGSIQSSRHRNLATEDVCGKVMIASRMDQSSNGRRQEVDATVPGRRPGIRHEEVSAVDRRLLRGDQSSSGRSQDIDGRRQEVDATADSRPGRTQEVVIPDGRHVTVGVGHGDSVMKRKTLRRCDDGRMSVSESFTTESETSEAGKYSTIVSPSEAGRYSTIVSKEKTAIDDVCPVLT